MITAPVVKWISQQSSELLLWVRFLPGAQFSLTPSLYRNIVPFGTSPLSLTLAQGGSMNSVDKELPKKDQVVEFCPKNKKDKMAGKIGKIFLVPLQGNNYSIEFEDETTEKKKSYRWADISEIKRKINIK